MSFDLKCWIISYGIYGWQQGEMKGWVLDTWYLIVFVHLWMSQVGGPSYAVKLGRRDSTTASRTLANAELPAFSESLESLISRFQKKGLTARDMVALSGSHTLGQAQCFTFRERIYNHSNIDAGFDIAVTWRSYHLKIMEILLHQLFTYLLKMME